VLAGGGGQRDAVAADALLDGDRLDRRLHPQQPGRVGDGLEVLGLLPPVEPPPEHVPLLVVGRVAEGDPHQEPVQLRLGQRVGAFVLDRVGRGQHVERRLQREGLPLDRDLALLHRLEQRGLGLGRGAVHLVGEQQPGEQGAGPEVELGALLVVDERAGQVRRQQVRG